MGISTENGDQYRKWSSEHLNNQKNCAITWGTSV